jgi:hypothetical protein
VKLVRTAADITALTALSDMVTGELAIVPGDGVFRFNGASSATSDARWIVAPGSVDGRWERLEHGLRESTLGGLATITGLAVGDLVLVPGFGVYRYTAQSPSLARTYWRVAATAMSGLFEHVAFGMIDPTGGTDGASTRLDASVAPVPNRIVEIDEIAPASGSFVPASSSPGAAFGPTLTLSVEAGDIVEITGQIALVEDNAANLSIIMCSGTTVLGNGKVILKTIATLPAHIFTRYVALAGATLSIRFGGICSSATSVTFTEAGIVARIIRP